MANLKPFDLNKLGFDEYQQVTPKQAFSHRLDKSMQLITQLPENLTELNDLFAQELKEIIWLSKIDESAPMFASAAFPEVSGKVFLTSAVFAFVPPNIVATAQSPYWAFENIVHECLHHRGEKLFYSKSTIKPFMILDRPINVSWRNTSWSFSHAIQAYYIYCWVKRLRLWRSEDTTENHLVRETLKSSLPEVTNIIDELESQLCQVIGLHRFEFRTLLGF